MTNRPQPGHIFIFAGVSGSGKTTMCKSLSDQGWGRFSISHTTRKKSAQEIDGEDYFFITPDKFQAMLERNEMLESAIVHGSMYGTSQTWLEQTLAAGQNVLLEIDVQGAAQAKAKLKDVHSVFILPPSFEILEQRLIQRRREDSNEITRRLHHGLTELLHLTEFDFMLVNDDLAKTLATSKIIIKACTGDLKARAQADTCRTAKQATTVKQWCQLAEDRLKSLPWPRQP